MVEQNQEQREDHPIKVFENQQGIQDVPRQDVMYSFNGAWLPSIDASLIGAKNFQELTNMRYNDGGIEGVNGYSLVNSSTALSTYVYVKNGFHFQTNRANDTYVVARAENSGGTGRLYVNKTAIGSTGDFTSSIGERASGSYAGYLWEDTSASLVGRFSKAPSGYMAYANEEEVFTWSGEEAVPGAIFTTEDSSETNPIDVTEKLTNSRSDASNRVTIDSTGRDYMVIMTTRPIQGFKFYIHTANDTAASLDVDYWSGTAWANVANDDDNTLDTATSTKTLNKTGTYLFDFVDRDTAKPLHFQERYLYAYRIGLSAGSAVIYEISVNAPAQAPTNVWDGVYRVPIQAQFFNNADDAYEDYTLHVSESSTVNTPVGMILDGMTTDDHVIVMFEEQMSGLKLTMLANLINKANAQIDATDGVQYWDGDSWANLSFTDGTLDSAADSSFAQSGLIYWNPPSDEEKTTLFNTIGYAYKITVDATLTDATAGKDTEDVVVDLIDGIPARKEISVYKFPVIFKNKLMYCGATKYNEGNRVDFCTDSAPDVWNGDDSSMDGLQSIYVGSVDELTAGIQLYNRFGSNIYTMLLLLKEAETHILIGDGPLDYKLYPISLNIGCPAPLTLTTAEIGQQLGEAISRNVAMWVSSSGPIMFDGATIAEIPGLEKYFDPNESEAVNFDVIDEAQGWFDPVYQEYNILLATGSNTTPNKWFCFDVVRNKWFEKDVGVAEDVKCGFQVTASNGDQYIYGGLNTGYIVLLEDGTAWNTTAITNTVRTGDFFPSGNEWDVTNLKKVRVAIKGVDEDGAQVKVYYYKNTAQGSGQDVDFVDAVTNITNSGTAGVSFVDATQSITNSGNAGVSWFEELVTIFYLDIDIGLDRVYRDNATLNKDGWAHSLKFEFTSDTTAKGMQPLMWGYQWSYRRKDYKGSDETTGG